MAKQLPLMRYNTPALPQVNLSKYRQNRRKSAVLRGYNYRWQKVRIGFLTLNPLCTKCEAQGRVVAAKVVDHIEPHKNDPVLFWDQDNWQGLCYRHHNRKTAQQDGGFGNTINKEYKP